MKGVSVFDLWSVFTAWPSGFKIGEVGFVVHRSGRAEVWCVGLSCGLSSLRVVRSLFFSLSLSFCLSPQQALCSYPRWLTEIAAGPGGLMSGWHTHTHSFTPLCSLRGGWGISLFFIACLSLYMWCVAMQFAPRSPLCCVSGCVVSDKVMLSTL